MSYLCIVGTLPTVDGSQHGPQFGQRSSVQGALLWTGSAEYGTTRLHLDVRQPLSLALTAEISNICMLKLSIGDTLTVHKYLM